MVRSYIKPVRRGWFKITYLKKNKPRRGIAVKQFSPLEVDRYLNYSGDYHYACIKEFDTNFAKEGAIKSSPIHLNYIAVGQHAVWKLIDNKNRYVSRTSESETFENCDARGRNRHSDAKKDKTLVDKHAQGDDKKKTST